MGIPIFSEIEKLINEHGSAAILKERLSLAADEYAALQRKLADSATDNEKLVAKIQLLEKQNTDLQSQLDVAKSALQQLQKQSQTHDIASLDEPKKRLLAALASGPKAVAHIKSMLNLSSESLKYHLDTMSRLIELYDWEDKLRLTKAGRQVAVQLGILDAG